MPRPLRTACAVLALEALGLAGIAAFLLVRTVIGSTPDSVGRALLDAVMALLGAAVLALGARGLLRLNQAARTPVLIIQLLALPVAYSIFQAGLVGYAGPMLIAALAVIYLLFTPPVREIFDRELPK